MNGLLFPVAKALKYTTKYPLTLSKITKAYHLKPIPDGRLAVGSVNGIR